MKTSKPKSPRSAFIKLWPDFGKRCNLGRDSTYTAASRGEIPAVRIGGLWRVPREAGEEFLRTGVNPLRHAREADGTGHTGAAA